MRYEETVNDSTCFIQIDSLRCIAPWITNAYDVIKSDEHNVDRIMSFSRLMDSP